MTERRIATQEEWQAEREALLEEEKDLTRRSDELARKRRELPWVPIEEDYRFETEAGAKTLAPQVPHLKVLGTRPCCSPPARRSQSSSRIGSGWAGGIPWVSSGGSDFNRDLGFLHTEEELKPVLEVRHDRPRPRARNGLLLPAR
jgi:predicted dithiol-disulfide oxidoreductase (DUF899 family)